MTTRATLQKALNRIEAYLPHLLEHFPEPGEFWSAFAGEAEAIIEDAGPEHDWAADKLESMLTFHGAPSP
ncbi:hypothetical protein [Dyella sp. SG609]|uniref:hypothetical protein n=1 Tax=Dyella sp. SG609 TaxID=2587018 RepID=UPI0014455187|nr:hypothetical protein [Dyella sp. SG609]NKJ21962.1 hypothetical protein [Dyella sp. SG609]